MSPKLSPKDMEFIDMRMRELGAAQRRGLEEKLDARLAGLEAALGDRIDALETAVSEAAGGDPAAPGHTPPGPGRHAAPGTPDAGAGQAESALALCRSQGARLALLEESFARICNLVGRLDQELEMLREEVRGAPKG